MKRLVILSAVAMVTATAFGCANRRDHCHPPTPAPAPVPACGVGGAYGTTGAYLGAPGGVYTGPDGYLPTPN